MTTTFQQHNFRYFTTLWMQTNHTIKKREEYYFLTTLNIYTTYTTYIYISLVKLPNNKCLLNEPNLLLAPEYIYQQKIWQMKNIK